MSGILAITEPGHALSCEAVAAAQRLGRELEAPVTACVYGADAAEWTHYDLAGVVALNHELLAEYTPDAVVAALAALIGECKPDYVVLPHTYRTRDFAPRLAARFRRTLIGDVTGFEVDAGRPAFVRPVYQGKLNGVYVFETPAPNFVSVQAGSFPVTTLRAGDAVVSGRRPELSPAMIGQTVEAPFRESSAVVDLSAADRIVAVGRGIAEESNMTLIKELAGALGAEVAASRPVCDNGWLGIERQVGSSGQTVAPRLYVAVGISGAIQHIVGMKGARTIVAINRDETAPIFEIAHYGIVGDLFEIVPALIDRLRG